MDKVPIPHIFESLKKKLGLIDIRYRLYRYFLSNFIQTANESVRTDS